MKKQWEDTWTTRDEKQYLLNIGTWSMPTHKRFACNRLSKKEHLIKYLNTFHLTKKWGKVNPHVVLEYAKTLLENL